MEASQEAQGAPAGQAAPATPQQEAPAAPEAAPAEEADRSPAADQATVATEAQKTITGDPGFAEGQPVGSEGGTQHVDRPVGTSMGDPSMQPGTPLPEDRAAEAADQDEAAGEQEKAAD
jgi:hypothetical protein